MTKESNNQKSLKAHYPHYSFEEFITDRVMMSWPAFLSLISDNEDEVKEAIERANKVYQKDYNTIRDWIYSFILAHDTPQGREFWDAVNKMWDRRVDDLFVKGTPIFITKPTEEQLKAFYGRPIETDPLYFKDFLAENIVLFEDFLKHIQPENQRWWSKSSYHVGYRHVFRLDPSNWIARAFDLDRAGAFGDTMQEINQKWRNKVMEARNDDRIILAEPTTKSLKPVNFKVFLTDNGIDPYLFKCNCDIDEQRWSSLLSHYDDIDELGNQDPRYWIEKAFCWERSRFNANRLAEVDDKWNDLIKNTAIEVIKFFED